MTVRLHGSIIRQIKAIKNDKIRVTITKEIFSRCSLLKPSYDRQIEVLTSAISEIIWRCAGGFAVSTCSNVVGNTMPKAVVALPQDTPYLQHSVQYFQDGLTETVRLLFHHLF